MNERAASFHVHHPISKIAAEAGAKMSAQLEGFDVDRQRIQSPVETVKREFLPITRVASQELGHVG